MDPQRLLQPNAFAEDDGTEQAVFTQALAIANPMRRHEAVVAALTTGRVLLAVQAHPHPGHATVAAIGRHVAGGEESGPSGEISNVTSNLRVDGPGGRPAFAVFSSADQVGAFDSAARPLPLGGKTAAARALATGGMLVVNPGDEQEFVGRSALAAISAAEPWLAPWNDTDIATRIGQSVRDCELVRGLSISMRRGGVTLVLLHMAQRAERAAAADAVVRASQAIAHDEYLRARLDAVEVVPVRDI
ncbi:MULTISPECIES: SseB family protein [unclassified Actinobaculum]|uniref:SseB family protein n=1 Tax=unclassified Actinobaculum TaxID=2609299 RepID=UPI000D526081|nr:MULTISPECIES: SseB family protein [unclassified Actinobaculum]AWE42317.1 hypothetical protein DDD63_05630 [Actinobaculum sp. 313]RTE50885.1 hypothetical protein EKN07_01785 [Actinobaculum sp. 352]